MLISACFVHPCLWRQNDWGKKNPLPALPLFLASSHLPFGKYLYFLVSSPTCSYVTDHYCCLYPCLYHCCAFEVQPQSQAVVQRGAPAAELPAQGNTWVLAALVVTFTLLSTGGQHMISWSYPASCASLTCWSHSLQRSPTASIHKGRSKWLPGRLWVQTNSF